jgi:GNAT superfamily N-acetyltransferase
MKVDILINEKPCEEEVLKIYKANGWSSAEKPQSLLAGLHSSHTLLTARSNNLLIGLANAISDGHLVVYFPHLLVHPDFQRRGIGRKLMTTMLQKYADFHQIMLTRTATPFASTRGLGLSKRAAPFQCGSMPGETINLASLMFANSRSAAAA